MNVDILETNPDWRWYLLFSGGCLILTALVWLFFKQIEVCGLSHSHILHAYGLDQAYCSETFKNRFSRPFQGFYEA